MNRATDFRMNHALYVLDPYTAEGYQAVVSIRRASGSSSRDRFARALHLMALYAYGKAADLCTPKRSPVARVLTEREREVLQWTSIGKSSWEISQILGVAESTVTAHIKAAAAKLDTPNRVATVVVALRRGEISLSTYHQFPKLGIT